MDPDPEGPESYGSYESGSGTLISQPVTHSMGPDLFTLPEMMPATTSHNLA